MYEKLGITKEVEELVNKAEEKVKPILEKLDKNAEINSINVLSAFQKYRVSDVHFTSTTGYGYDDIGRECVENIFAEVLKGEDALVRTQIVSGTHALTIALFAMLRPGDTLISIAGKPYDTLEKVIGIEDNPSSLKSFGVKYEQIDLIDNDFDYNAIQERVARNDVKVIEIQRSRGYSLRKSITLDKIEKAIRTIRKVNESAIIMIDNCYGEFTNEQEPSNLGADILVGSLIKNLGGGIAPNGAYVVGRKDLIQLVAERLTLPGEGRDVGPTLGMNKKILQGLFLAPSVVASSLKTAVLTSKVMQNLEFKVDPNWDEQRSDIVQTIQFDDREKLIKYCQGIQMGSPIDSNSIPIPGDMPGYTDQVIMAAGAFTQGSSIELSCDAPLRPPYVAYQQGGLTYEYGKLGVMKAVGNLLKK